MVKEIRPECAERHSRIILQQDNARPCIAKVVKTYLEDVENAVKGFFDHASELELKVSLTKRQCQGNRKAFVLLEEVWALKLLKATHMKIGWIACRVRQKMEVNRCYRCLGFSHIAANCRGPNRRRTYFTFLLYLLLWWYTTINFISWKYTCDYNKII